MSSNRFRILSIMAIALLLATYFALGGLFLYKRGTFVKLHLDEWKCTEYQGQTEIVDDKAIIVGKCINYRKVK